MIKSTFKRGAALLLALIMFISLFTVLVKPVNAASETSNVVAIAFPRNDDVNYSTTTWGHGEMTFVNGWHTGANKYYSVFAMDSWTGNICYCIELGVHISQGDSFTKKDENFWNNYPSDLNNAIAPDDVKVLIGRIFEYGYTGTISLSWRSHNEGDANKMAHAIATQLLIWETVIGERDADFNHIAPSGYSAVLDMIRADHPLRSKILSYYKSIENSVLNHTKVPSFMRRSTGKAQTAEFKWNGKEYEAVLTDTNHVLGNYTYSSDTAGIRFNVSGDTLTVTADSVTDKAVTITAEKNTSKRKGLIVWSDGVISQSGGKQDTVTFAQDVTDPVKGFLYLKASYGSARIIKTSEDGIVDGVSFRLQGNGVDQTVVTKNGGQIQVDNLRPGVYTVTEITDNKYEPQEIRRVTVVSGQTSTVTFSNVLKRGDLTVTKTSEDGLNEGVKFHLSGTSLSGHAVDEYAVTDSSGKAYFNDVLISGSTPYTLEEVDTGIRYVVPEKQTAAIEWNKVTNKSFTNILKKWQLTVTKSDKETGTAQGDATLCGAVYGIFKGGQLIDTYTTDANGQFTTGWYICDTDWSLREISASEGYLVTSGSEHIGVEPKRYTVEYNSAAPDVIETVRKGKVAVIKHCDDGSTQIETPEQGVEFEVYLKSSGSYANAKEAERDVLLCDEFGFAESKELPYGIYTVKQTKGLDGKELMPPFDVFISEDGETYRYLINNATFESLIEIVKKDIETGKVIPASGIGFKVRNTDTGEYIVQHINYPTPVDIDTYYTDATGKLMLPEALPFGNYEIIEQNTCFGYVLDSTPIPFKVDGSQTVVTVEKHNVSQKGTITVTKTGEMFSSVMESDGIYQPVYSARGLAGAIYEVTAAEDIYTQDGTLRYAKGEVVDTVTTDKDGTAVSKPLYLGKYEVQETKAPYGTVLNDEIHTVELTYAGQEISITETVTEFCNERQKAEISLSKVLDKDELFGIGNNGEILSVQFGLFAAEDLTAADGLIIPANGLLEIVNCDENGNAALKTDLPVGAKAYVMEIAANNGYVLSDEKYPIEFAYAGQDNTLVEIKVNDGEAIKNEILYGTVKGLKIDRETEELVSGALFGLFRTYAAEFTKDNAILTAESGEDGIFTFCNVPYGDWLIKEIMPAEGFLPNEEIYSVTVSENEQIIEITVVNDRIPEIGTLATVDGEKEICATEVFTLTDTVSYKHLIPGKEYVLNGVLMDKTTGEPLVINGQEIRSETVFTPENPTGEVTVTFTFDSKYIKMNTEIVVFETLFCDGTELAVHADIEDEGQTVTVKIPEIRTKATAEGKKEITADGRVMIEDTVSYKNLTPDKEYTVKGVLINKATGEPLLIDGKEIRSSFTFKPDSSDGEIAVTFVFDAAELTTSTEIVVFESLYRDDAEIAVHADIEDEDQTVKLTPPAPPVPESPQTGDNSNLGFWIGLGAVALGGLISCIIMAAKLKKDNDDE